MILLPPLHGVLFTPPAAALYPRVYVGGDFATIGGGAQANLACIGPDGLLVPGFAPSISSAVSYRCLWYDSFHNQVWVAVDGVGVICLDGDDGSTVATITVTGTSQFFCLHGDQNFLYIAGAFTTIGGVSSRYLARILFATGAVDSGWTPNLNVGESDIRGIASDGGLWVWLCGGFNSIRGFTRHRAAALDATDGHTVEAFNPNLNDAAEDILAPNDGSGLAYLTGYFSTVNGSVSRTGLAQVVSATGGENSWDPGAPIIADGFAAGEGLCLARYGASQVVVGGIILSSAGGTGGAPVARFNDGGTVDTAFMPDTGTGYQVYDLAVDAAGDVYAGVNLTYGVFKLSGTDGHKLGGWGCTADGEGRVIAIREAA